MPVNFLNGLIHLFAPKHMEQDLPSIPMTETEFCAGCNITHPDAKLFSRFYYANANGVLDEHNEFPFLLLREVGARQNPSRKRYSALVMSSNCGYHCDRFRKGICRPVGIFIQTGIIPAIRLPKNLVIPDP